MAALLPFVAMVEPESASSQAPATGSDRAALVALYNATDGPNWKNNTNWLSDRPIGKWHGVTTDASGRVVELGLRDNQLSGEIPPELGSLASLQSLDLQDNRLFGRIPAWLGSLTNLRMLNLSWNHRLHGEIPSELGNLAKLERLFLGANGIGGSIPSELGNLTRLRELWLGNGLGLTGELPPELSRLTKLEVIDLGHSDVSGPLPAWLGDLTRLRSLYLDGNEFTGQVPAELGNLNRLELLTLHGNSGMLGALPQTLTKITGLDWLTFHETGLCAPLDESFQAWLRSIPDYQGPNCFSGSGGRVIIRDMFGREVNETGIVLVDWEGLIANPAMKYSVELPGATATLSSTEPRLYFDLPSLVGANGPTKALASEDPAQAVEFRISIFPDRDTSDETHTLTIRYVGGGGRVSTQTIDVHVIDQDVDRPLEFNIIPDYSYDDTGMFDDPAAREAVQRMADDWAYFIADMDLDEVPVGEEQMWIWYPEEQRRQGLGDGITVTNDIAYTGFLMHVYGYYNEKITASGGPSCDGSNQSSGEVEFPIKRSGSITFDPRGNYDTFGWTTSVDEDTWWRGSGLGPTPNDLYPIALHEMGHALVFNGCQDGFAGFHEAREVRDAAVKTYYGSYPRTDRYSHFIEGTIDPASRRGAFGNENGAEVALGRWIVTKLDLLVAQAIGYTLRDTTPFRELSLLDEPLAEGRVGTLYTHTMNAVGGIPAYYWTIDSGALPDGLSLDSFTGTISGIPQESGTFELTIRVRDNTEGNPGVTHTATLNIEPPPDDCAGSAVADASNAGLVSDCRALLVARDALRGAAALNWGPDTPIARWNGIALGGSPQRVTKVKLQKRGLTGHIPAALGGLEMLEELWLYTNELTGSVPPELGNLTNLRWLFVADNDLGGQIPDGLNSLSLDRLWLQKNSFTGCVPYNLTLTREYKVDRGLPACAPPGTGPSPTPTPTSTVGTPTPTPTATPTPTPSAGTPTPTATPTPTPTARPDTCGAAVTDKSNAGLVSDCNALLAARDTLRGTAALNWSPDTLIARWNGIALGGSPKRVTKVKLQKRGLTGQIPAALGDLAMLEELWLYTNKLTGSIPPELGNLTNLRWLFVADNDLGGRIPEALNNLSLDRLWLQKNSFTGCVPYNLTLTREYKVDRGLTACAPPGSTTATPTPSAGTPTPTPTPTARPDTCGAAVTDKSNTGLVSDCSALLAARDTLRGTAALNWAADTPITQWDGVTARGTPRRVTELSLPRRWLNGEIPPELGGLSSLTRLSLWENHLSGEIPAELGGLSNLTRLYLNGNQLSGKIPSELGGLSGLEVLDLGGNQLIEEIPAELGGLSNLKELWLGWNQLSGEIPAELGGLSSLEALDFRYNQLSGETPAELGDLSNLKELYLGRNGLIGELPQSLTGLTKLESLSFDKNAGLCAPIYAAFQAWLQGIASVSGRSCAEDSPEDRAVLVALYNATDGANWTNNTKWLSDELMREWHGVTMDGEGRVSSLTLPGNQLSGEIPSELGNLSNLASLDLGGNQLSGEIPSELGGLSSLEVLDLSRNQLSGEIPSGLSGLSSLTSLDLGWNQLSGDIPAELEDLGDTLTRWRLVGNSLTGCVPAALVAVENNDSADLGLEVCASVERPVIAFASDRDGDSDIYVMEADGSGVRQLTNDSGWYFAPAWSPDGRWIAFASDVDGDWDVYVMRADGSGVRRLTTYHTGDDNFPAWSPDGEWIAFESWWRAGDSGVGIYVMRADGSGVRRLVDLPGNEFSPAWSPDGEWIAFESDRDTAVGLDGTYDIYVVKADGTEVRRLTTHEGRDMNAAWSPDGDWIVFQSDRDQDWRNFDIYVMRADGSGVRRLTNAPMEDVFPAWSPDGDWIAFQSFRDGDFDIYVMKVDGSGVRQLTNVAGGDAFPVWSMQSTRLAGDTPPPAAGPYYTQFVPVASVTVKAAAKVDPAALQEAAKMLRVMLDGPQDRCRTGALAIVPDGDPLTALPEFANLRGTRDHWGQYRDSTRSPGAGGTVTATPEQLLRPEPGYPPDRDIHEPAHLLQFICFAREDWRVWEGLHRRAVDKVLADFGFDRPPFTQGLMVDVYEFFAGLSQSYFFQGRPRRHVKQYFPEVFAFLEDFYGVLTPTETNRPGWVQYVTASGVPVPWLVPAGQTYEHSALGYHIDLLPGWGVESEGAGWVSLSDGEAYLTSEAYITIEYTRLPDGTDTGDELMRLAQSRVDEWEQSTQGWYKSEVRSFERVVSDGQESYWIHYYGHESPEWEEDIGRVERVLIASHGGGSYGVVLQGGHSRGGNYLVRGDLETMLRSFSP